MISQITMVGKTYTINTGNYSSVKFGGHSLTIKIENTEDLISQEILFARQLNHSLIKKDMMLTLQELEIPTTEEEIEAMTMAEFRRKIGKK